MVELENEDFDKRAYIRKLESLVYLFLILPLTGFAWVLLEREKAGTLRTTFFDQTDYMFHSVMLVGTAYILMRTIGTWKKDLMKHLDRVKPIDTKLKLLQRPLIYRNLMWALGAGIGAYGLYEKGDMLYAIVFTVFLILMTANRPSPHYFVRFFNWKGEEKDWILKKG